MLDPRVYRAAFAPVLLALVVVAFSLVDRPRPIETTLAPDAFDGAHAFATLRSLAARFPDRRPGSAGDERLAEFVAGSLRSSFCGAEPRCGVVSVRTASGETIAGGRTLRTVIANRLGQPGPGVVVVAHRDAAGRGAEAELSATAALLELGRVLGGRQTRRTLTLVSTSGGSGGAAGARWLAGHLPVGQQPPDAVLVLGDLASARGRKPWVLPWSDAAATAPLQLARTVESAVRTESGQDPGGPRATTQFGRLAFPFAIGEQGPLDAAGIPAVELQVSGERGPRAGAAVSPEHLRIFGRAALRTIDALDNGPDVRGAPAAQLVTRGKVLPAWAVRLLVAALLLPALLGSVDAFARVRRRRTPVAVWLRWLVALAAPFVLGLGLTRFLGAVGLVSAPPGAVVAGRVPLDGVALAAVGLAFVLGALAVRPLRTILALPGAAEGPGAAAAVALTTAVVACMVWVANPFAAAVLVLPAHLWLVAPAPEVRLRRAAAVGLVAVALAPAAAVVAVYASAVAASPLQLPWSLVLLVAGGQVGLPALGALCALAACAVGAVRLASRPPARERAPTLPAAPIRGPLGYAGPGSLGGTESALRVRR